MKLTKLTIKVLLLSLPIFFIVAGVINISDYYINKDKPPEMVDCYDKEGNKIMDTKCEEIDKGFDIGFFLIMIGLFTFTIFITLVYTVIDSVFDDNAI